MPSGAEARVVDADAYLGDAAYVGRIDQKLVALSRLEQVLIFGRGYFFI